MYVNAVNQVLVIRFLGRIPLLFGPLKLFYAKFECAIIFNFNFSVIREEMPLSFSQFYQENWRFSTIQYIRNVLYILGHLLFVKNFHTNWSIFLCANIHNRFSAEEFCNFEILSKSTDEDLPWRSVNTVSFIEDYVHKRLIHLFT